MEHIYRFEIAGPINERAPQSQQQGFLTGLEDVGMELAVESELYDLFEDLPVPPPFVSASCWFTETGLVRFADAIDAVSYELSCKNWRMFGSVVEMDLEEGPLYCDKWQAVLPCDYVERLRPTWIEVGQAKELLGVVPERRTK